MYLSLGRMAAKTSSKRKCLNVCVNGRFCVCDAIDVIVFSITGPYQMNLHKCLLVLSEGISILQAVLLWQRNE